MKGYHLKLELIYPELVTEMTLVGCKRCDNTWSELHTFHCGTRINGAIKLYDCCDKCKRDNDNLIDDITIEDL